MLETAHNMSREWRFLVALHGTDVPVPAPVAFCEDSSVIGAPFYVMDHVDGLILHNADDAAALPASARAPVAAGVAATLRHLHHIDVSACGLSGIGRGEDYIGRQLRRWQRQWQQSSSLADLKISAVDEAHRVLSSTIPHQDSVSVVHGDFRLGNMIVGGDGSIRAVLDWELATLGDPRADLGWLLLSWDEPGERRVSSPLGTPPSTLPGFKTRSELVAAYHADQATGADAADLDYFVAFAAWRWACISAGVYARYKANVMGGRSGDMAGILQTILDHAGYALALLGTTTQRRKTPERLPCRYDKCTSEHPATKGKRRDGL
ncbi:aminoglycoside phosphotransferase [Mycobacterium avium 09-5983]|nr:aminoglycoside phosphotransferase [Mycobacterium avium 09-5983]